MSSTAATTTTMTQTLDTLRKGQSAVVSRVTPHVQEGGTDFSHRLMELGFVRGEMVTVLAKGFWSGEPIAVRVGSIAGGTTFALRRFEAAQISVDVEPVAAN